MSSVPPHERVETVDPPPAAPPARGPARPGAVRRALEEFSSLTGKQPESVTGLRPVDGGGWSVLVDILELERIPSSTSVMAIYRIDVADDGELVSCERLRRYTRGATDS